MLPPMSWAFAPDVSRSPLRSRARPRALLDEAGYPDPDGDGPAPRLRLTLKVSNTEFNRLQSAVIQQDLRAVGVALDVRTYEFATLYADVLKGNFQLFTLQWVGVVRSRHPAPRLPLQADAAQSASTAASSATPPSTR